MPRSILIHPDPRLRKVCDPITEFGEDLKKLADEMLGTMYAAPGIGLAAPQIGVNKRLLVMDCVKTDDGETPQPVAMINPEILGQSDELRDYEEGCLSIPDTFAPVTRPEAVRVRWQDVDGVDHERDFEGLWAVCVQHEMDHLDGKLFIDFLSATKRQMITQKMKKLKRERARG